MTDTMVHRGPDDRGTIIRPGAALGARRLSIVDIEGGHQPFANEDGSVTAVQNGELYNHESIRSELSADGHRFGSRCDSEILPHLYERDGTDFVSALRGKFGVAVHDARTRRAVVARDRLGVKPMYYAITGDFVVFGSELKSILASGLVTTELDLEALDAYFSFGFVPAPRTPLLQVRKLLPGEQLIVENERVRVERYWRLPTPKPEPLGVTSEREWADRLLSELEESVRLRLMSDVPLGAMLSGGLDSSLIVALMARHLPRPVETFAVGFVEAGSDNELAAARAVASYLGTNHHELELSIEREDIDLADLSWHMDEPVADLSALGFLALSRLAASHVTVALSGQGADELLGGYSRHRNAAIARSLLRLPQRPRQHAIAAVGRLQGLRTLSATLGAADSVTRQLAAIGASRAELAPALAHGPLGSKGDAAARAAIADRLDGAPLHDPLASMLHVDLQLGLVDDMLHYFDRTSMAASLEVRVPFLDHHVVEFCTRIPTQLKVRGLRTKHILREAARGLVPDDVINRRKVGFFNAAVEAWFNAQTGDSIARYLLSDRPAYAEIADPGEVAQLVKRHREGTGGSRGLLALLMLEIWLTEYLPRATSRTSTPAGRWAA